MIKVHKYTKGAIKEGSLSDLKTKQTIVWADCFNPSPKELKDISSYTGILLEDLKETVDEEERPKVMDLENYSLIIFRAPLFKKDGILTTPISIFLSKNKNNIITIRLKDIKSVERIKDLMEKNKIKFFEKGISSFVYKLLDEILNTYFHVLDIVDENIDKIEERVFEKPDRVTVEHIFETKKTLIYFHKALTANREVITAIEKEYVAHIQKKDIKKFRTLYNDVVQLIDEEGTYRDVLTGTLDIYLSSVSNNLNIVMKKLTAMASFVLIPTLISGIYGMNFQRMPELYWTYGYYFALALMVVSVTAMYIYFKRKEWI